MHGDVLSAVECTCWLSCLHQELNLNDTEGNESKGYFHIIQIFASKNNSNLTQCELIVALRDLSILQSTQSPT